MLQACYSWRYVYTNIFCPAGCHHLSLSDNGTGMACCWPEKYTFLWYILSYNDTYHPAISWDPPYALPLLVIAEVPHVMGK